MAVLALVVTKVLSVCVDRNFKSEKNGSNLCMHVKCRYLFYIQTIFTHGVVAVTLIGALCAGLCLAILSKLSATSVFLRPASEELGPTDETLLLISQFAVFAIVLLGGVNSLLASLIGHRDTCRGIERAHSSYSYVSIGVSGTSEQPQRSGNCGRDTCSTFSIVRNNFLFGKSFLRLNIHNLKHKSDHCQPMSQRCYCEC